MKVLIIEDNVRLAERIQAILKKLYLVDVATTGEEGILMASSINYSLIILDLGLPDIPGDQVCQLLRNQQINTPVLVLTANADITSKVKLLDNGADDYLTKPFSGAELNSRVGVIIRRQDRPILAETMVVNDLELDPASRLVRRAGKNIILRRKEFDILEYLISNRGRAVTREMIINHAWVDGVENWNNTVDVHIKHLRDKIDRPFSEQLIKTAYGIGYMIKDSQDKP